MAERSRGPGIGVAPGVLCVRTLIANLFLVGEPGARPGAWVLVDAGLGGFSAGMIRRAAAAQFGPGSRPGAILLTHGHFDHVGALPELAREWDVPIYAHHEELPFLTGRADYLPPDPTVGGGMMAWLSFLYPRRAIDLGSRVRPLPENGVVPLLPGWRWIHTPGHTPGHVSFYRESDRVLIAGDAFVTVQQESALAVLTQRRELHGPPAYFTPEWLTARESVRSLAALRPAVAATGHGLPMRGEALTRGLDRLAREFDWLAIPPQGRYVPHGAAERPGPVQPAPARRPEPQPEPTRNPEPSPRD